MYSASTKKRDLPTLERIDDIVPNINSPPMLTTVDVFAIAATAAFLAVYCCWNLASTRETPK